LLMTPVGKGGKRIRQPPSQGGAKGRPFANADMPGIGEVVDA